jgi:uncharacterized protein (DUF433 family)
VVTAQPWPVATARDRQASSIRPSVSATSKRFPFTIRGGNGGVRTMAEAVEAVLAIPDKRAANLARITMRKLRYWERTGLIVPSIRQEISPRNIVRLYAYQDLLGLLVAAELRNRVSLQHIRRVVTHLREQGFAEPLRELRFATHGNDVYFQYPDGSWSGDPLPDQVIFHQVISLDPLRARIPEAGRRSERAAGKVVRRRGVLGSKPIFAGTRILVASVQHYLRAGYGTEAILEEYPALTPADIQTARDYSPWPDEDGLIARANYQR